MHALDQAIFGSISGDPILAVLHLGAQLLGAPFQPLPGTHDGAVLRAQLGLHVDIHRVVDRGGSKNRIFCRERNLQHPRRLQRCDDECSLDGMQCRVAHRIQFRSRQIVGGLGRHGETRHEISECPPCRCECTPRQRWWKQGRVEFRVGMQVEPIGHLLDDRHAAEHFGLRRHHRVGDRICPQDALQLTHLILGRVIDQRAGGRVVRRELVGCDIGDQRCQHHRHKQRQPPSSQDGEDRRSAWSCPVDRTGWQTIAQYRWWRSRSGCGSVEHRQSWLKGGTGRPDQRIHPMTTCVPLSALIPG
jgi:hypothetical protein